MKEKVLQKLLLIVLVLSANIGCDQTTKRMAEHSLKNADMKSMFFDIFRLQYTENPGAFLGFGADFNEITKLFLFVLLPIVALLIMFIVALFSKNASNLKIVSYSMIIGGGMGNLIDRLFLNGLVTDFLNIGIGPLRSGIFNVADIAIMIGGVLLLYMHLQEERSLKKIN
jgi:signal peptidase II